jgi:TP901 family phage tail tape measure protein
MADLEKTVSILFKGVDEVSGTMDKIGGSLSNLGTSLKSATQPFADMALAVEKFEATLAVLAAGGMVAAVSAAGVFQSGLNEIHTLLRESPEVVAAFDDAIEDYARNSTQSLEDIQAAIYQALSANVDYTKSIEFVTEAEKLAVAGKSTLKESVDLLTSVMTTYGASWNEAAQYSDIFFKTVEIGKVTIPELSGALGMVAPIAATAGVSIKEISAAMAGMTAGGLTSSQSAEYLRQVISDLIKPSDGSVEAFKKLGIAFGSAELASGGLSGKLKEIWEKSGGSADTIIKLFGNVTSFTAASVLGADKAGYYAKALEAIETSAGSTDRAYRIMVNNIENINTRLVNSMKLALIESGKPLLDDWANIADGLGKVFQGVQFGLKQEAFSEIYTAIESFATQFSDYLRDVAKAIPEAMEMVDFNGLLTSIKELGGSLGVLFKNLFGDFDLTKPTDLAAALQKVINAVTKLTEFSTGIAEQMQPFAKELGIWVDKAISADTETTKLAGNVAGFGQVVNTMVKALEFVGPALAVLSSSLIVQAVATVGKLAAGLAALPGGPAILAAAGVTALGVAAYNLGEKYNEANTAIARMDKILGITNEEVLAAKEQTDAFSASINKLPAMTKLMFQTDIDTAIDSYKELNDIVVTFPESFSIEAKTETEAAANKLNELRYQFEAFPPETFLKFSTDKKEIDDLSLQVEGLPSIKKLTIDAQISNADYIKQYMSEEITPTRTIDINLSMGKASRDEFFDEMKRVVNPDGTITWVDVSVQPGAVEKAKKNLDEIPTEKMLEIKLQGQIDKELATIKAGAETMQKAMEWTAKVNIADIEASAKNMESMFGSINTGISATSNELSKLLTANWDNMGISQVMALQEEMRRTQSQKEKEFKLQEKLIQAQIDLMKTKDYMMKKGKGLIQIDSTGLEPALEMIMWQILQKVQLKANEDSASFLLGIQ